MKKNVKGVILVIVGSYFLFCNTIFSILFDRVYVPCIPTPDGPACIPLDPKTYFELWLTQHGWITILIALGGLALIIYGIRHFLIKKEFDNSKRIST